MIEMAPVEPVGSMTRPPYWTAKRSVGPEGPGQPEPAMSVAPSVSDVLAKHVVLSVECIDRMYLNAYVLSSSGSWVWSRSFVTTEATHSRRLP